MELNEDDFNILDKAEHECLKRRLCMDSRFAGSNLNHSQIYAARIDFDKSSLVFAGAGSGKTRTMIYRAKNLLEFLRPESLVMITFTRNAAKEIRKRLISTITFGAAATKIHLYTFHSLALHICRSYGHLIGLPIQFSLYDRKEIAEIVKSGIMKALPVEYGRYLATQRNAEEKSTARKYLRSVIDSIQKAKLSLNPEANIRPNSLLPVLLFYQQQMSLTNCLDFSDLLHSAIKILTQHPDCFRHLLCHGDVHSQFHIIVDEFQDTSNLQYQLLKNMQSCLSITGSCGVTAVGDDNQSIYSFQGAQIRNFKSFLTDFTPSEVVLLETNYRCSANIVKASDSVVGQIHANDCGIAKRNCTSSRCDGDCITVANCCTEISELSHVLKTISMLVSTNQLQSLSDVAILYRTNLIGRWVTNQLKTSNIPYVIGRQGGGQGASGGQVISVGRVVSKLLFVLRLVVNLDDNVAFIHCLTSIGSQISSDVLHCIERESERTGVSLFAAMKLMIDCDSDDNNTATSKKRKRTAEDMMIKRLVSFEKQISTLLKRLDDLSLSEFVSRCINLIIDPSQEDVRGIMMQEADVFSREYKPPALPIVPVHMLQAFLDSIVLGLMEDDGLYFSLNETSGNKIRKLRSIGISQQQSLEAKLVKRYDSHQLQPQHLIPGSIWVSTIHQSKGLEWKAVFVIRMNERVLPLPFCQRDDDHLMHLMDGLSGGSDDDYGDYMQPVPMSHNDDVITGNIYLEEETRLAYVAMTRAADFLSLSFIACSCLKDKGSFIPMEPSRFIDRIPINLVTRVSCDDMEIPTFEQLFLVSNDAESKNCT